MLLARQVYSSWYFRHVAAMILPVDSSQCCCSFFAIDSVDKSVPYASKASTIWGGVISILFSSSGGLPSKDLILFRTISCQSSRGFVLQVIDAGYCVLLGNVRIESLLHLQLTPRRSLESLEGEY